MKAALLAVEMFLTAFKTREVGGLAAWMEKNIVVRATENPGKPGPYDSSYTPLIPKLLDEFFQGNTWNELHVQKSSQSSLSFHALGALTRKVAEDPGNAMYVIDSDKEAKKISSRLTAFLEDSPATSLLMKACEELTILTYEFSDMMLWLTGAGSAGSLANKTATLGISDETDKHKDHRGEAATVDLLRSRLKEQVGSKLLDYSTPTTVTGQIHREYITGSQHKAHVPCPHCGFFQELVWDRVKFGHCKDLAGEWDMGKVLLETYYECSSCEGKIEDHHKREMLPPGIWIPTNYRTITGVDGKDERVPAWFPNRMSAHYSDLYSQNENVSFGRLAIKFLAALRDPKKMTDFLQNHLGLPDNEHAAEVTEDKILALRGPYKRQQLSIRETLAPIDSDGQTTIDIGTPIPIRPLFAALLSDTQDENSKYTIQAFSITGDQYVIDWDSCLELLDLDDVFQRKVRWAVRDENGETESGEMPISVAMIDEGGHRSFEVREYCYDRFPNFFTSRGSSGTGGGSSVGLRDYRIRKDSETTIPVVVYDDNTFKRELYIRNIARFDPVKAAAYGQSRLWLPSNLDTSLTSELMKEKLVRDKFGRLAWNTPKGNDFGDTVKMGKILWAYIGESLAREYLNQETIR